MPETNVTHRGNLEDGISCLALEEAGIVLAKIPAIKSDMTYLRTQVTRWFYVLGVFAGLASPSAHAAELIMFESETCTWCQKWIEEIGPIYPKTSEGKCAPLRTVDLGDSRDGGLTEIGPVVFTPTFVVAENGQEIGRLVGYAGEDFFWYLLSEQLDKAQVKCAN